MTRRARHAVAVLAVALGVLGFRAQPNARQTGQLSGVVYDQTGGALASVTVTLKGPDNRTTTTDQAGRFEFRDLSLGSYALRAELRDFEPVRRDVRIQAGDAVTLSLTLVVAILEQTVVTAAKSGAGDVQSTPMAVSALSDADLTRLSTPTIDQAAAMMPSVTFTQNGTFGQLSIRGMLYFTKRTTRNSRRPLTRNYRNGAQRCCRFMANT